jgi:nucleotide-binding universal stress UspA family protein
MKKTLVATDFSPHAERALEHGIALARLFGGTVELFSSAYIPPTALAAMATGMSPGLIQQARDETHNRLEALAAKLRGKGLDVTCSSSTDEPSLAICARAKEIGAELVAMGTRGHTGIAHVVFGSIAERVARLAHCSVLTAHADSPAPSAYRRVLVPTDFSPDADLALAWARKLVEKTGGKLVVLHSYDLPALLTGGAAFSAPSIQQSLQTAARERLDLLKKTLSGVDVEAVLSHGRPDLSILETAESERVDLIAMGTRGRTGLAHVVMGSTAERVLRRAHQPVVTLKLTNPA